MAASSSAAAAAAGVVLENNASLPSGDAVIVAPLVPRLLASLTVVDLVLAPLLLFASLVLYDLFTPSASPANEERLAHVHHAKTAHARMRPKEARHHFSYPVLYVGVDLEQLERGVCDEPPLFRFQHDHRLRWALTSLSKTMFFDMQTSSSLIERLRERCTKVHGYDGAEIARAYTVCIPALAGFEGINPLVTHFLYDAQGQWTATVLEVHNTFGDRHTYLLQCGKDEDSAVRKGCAPSFQHSVPSQLNRPRRFDKQWTFARSFHVSPFNDRSGSYRVSLCDPLKDRRAPSVHIRIVLLASDGGKKLFASLDTTDTEPLTRASLARALARWPLALLLTMPRILKQAALLHYKHRLAVFPRPDPFVRSFATKTPNEPGSLARTGHIDLPDSFTGTDKWARQVLQRHVERYNEGETPVRLVCVAASQTQPDLIVGPSDAQKTLELTYITPQMYIDIVSAPSPAVALAVASKREARWTASDEALFLAVFNSAPTRRGSSSRVCDSLRVRQAKWSLSFSEAYRQSGQELEGAPLHVDGLGAILRLLVSVFVSRLSYWGFSTLARAEYVVGTEPWMELARWYDGEVAGKGYSHELGSIMR